MSLHLESFAFNGPLTTPGFRFDVASSVRHVPVCTWCATVMPWAMFYAACRAHAMAVQFQRIFDEAELPLRLFPYRILPVTSHSGYAVSACRRV